MPEIDFLLRFCLQLLPTFVTIHGSGMRIYCTFRMNMIQVRGDFCRAKLSISPRTVTMSGS